MGVGRLLRFWKTRRRGGESWGWGWGDGFFVFEIMRADAPLRLMWDGVGE